MPSIMTLDGAQFGAIAAPVAPHREYHRDLIEYGHAQMLGRGQNVSAIFSTVVPGVPTHYPVRVKGTRYGQHGLLGTIAVPRYLRSRRGLSGLWLPTCSRKCPSTMLCTSTGMCNCYGIPCQRTGPLRSLAGAVSTGFGEITDKTKTALVLLGALGIVGVVGYAGYQRAARRRRRRR